MYTYLASPYSSGTPSRPLDSKALKAERYKLAMHAVHTLMSKGEHVFSPILYTHEMALRYSLPKDFHFWREFSLDMINGAGAFCVLTLPGWLDSEGVQFELSHARDRKMPIYLLNVTHEDFDLKYQLVDYSIPA